jgi:hypothetical protein
MSICTAARILESSVAFEMCIKLYFTANDCDFFMEKRKGIGRIV